MKTGDTSGGEQAGNLPARRTGRFGDDKDPNVGKDTRFQRGQSGNPAGRRKGPNLSTHIQKMLDDPNFIDRLSEKIKARIVDAEGPDPEFQDIPTKAIITTAIIEAIDPTNDYKARQAAREWLAKYGYGTKVDITSKGERIAETPKIISVIQPREDGDAETQAEAS